MNPIDKAIEVCEQWFAYNERQKQNTITLQKAATYARRGDRKEALRLKSSIDNQPKVYDGARLEPAVKLMVKALRDMQELDVDGLKKKIGSDLSYRIRHSYSDNTMLNTVDYISQNYHLIRKEE